MAQSVEGSAESPESIAVLGRKFTLYLMLAGPWQQARQLKGPTTAAYSIAGLTKERDRLWRGERPIRVTVGSDAAQDDRGTFEQLIALSGLDEVDIQVGPQPAGPPLLPSVSVMSFVPSSDPTKFGLQVSAEPNTTWGVDLGSPEWPALAAQVFPKASPEVAREFYLELQAHESQHRDLFVTTSGWLLRHRFGSGWPSRLGLFDPEEAQAALGLYLRARRQFVVSIDSGYRTRLDQTLFYGSVTRSLLPRTHSALSSCLAPSQRRLRDAGEYLESILARFANLCVAHDELGRVAQREGWLDGNNGTLGEQLYHLQWSLVLVTGSLDALAWVTVKRAGATPNRREVSWRRLVAENPPRWLRDARSDDAMAMREAARLHAQRPLADLAYDLRDALQHRLPPRAGVACIQDNLRIDRAKLAALHLDGTLGRTAVIANGPGMLSFAGHQYLLPAAFQAGLLSGMAQLVDELIGVVDWPDSHWWQADQSWARQGAEQLRLARQARTLF